MNRKIGAQYLFRVGTWSDSEGTWQPPRQDVMNAVKKDRVVPSKPCRLLSTNLGSKNVNNMKRLIRIALHGK
jgi:hypothetical protein